MQPRTCYLFPTVCVFFPFYFNITEKYNLKNNNIEPHSVLLSENLEVNGSLVERDVVGKDLLVTEWVPSRTLHFIDIKHTIMLHYKDPTGSRKEISDYHH
jgi:hypothetical protein